MADFLQWFRQRGGSVHPALDLFAALPNGDRGVVAAEDIEEGAVLVTVPHAITVHVPSEQGPPGGSGSEVWSYLAKSHPGTSPFLSTVLVLMAEMAKGKDSDLYPYIQFLPKDCIPCLLNWSEEEKEVLKGTTIESTGDEADTVFQREVLPRMQGKPELWPSPYNTLPEFLTAAALVQSRAFHMESNNWVTGAHQEGTELYLIPAIDMINHSTDPALRNTTLHSYNVASSSSSGDVAAHKGPFFSMKAEKPIKKGQQIFHTYGDLSDAQLLQTYGFIDCPPSASGASEGGLQHNPHNYVLLSWDLVVTACRAALASACQGDKKEMRSFNSSIDSKLALLRSARVVPPSSKPGPVQESPLFAVSQAEPLPEQLLTSLQVLLMAEDDVAELRQEYEQDRKKKKAKKGSKASSSSDAATTEEAPPPLSLGMDLLDEDEDFAQVVAMAAMQLADKAMPAYPSSFKEDEQLLKDNDLPMRRRLALIVRQGERHVLLTLKKRGLALLMGGGGDESGGSEEGDE